MHARLKEIFHSLSPPLPPEGEKESQVFFLLPCIYFMQIYLQQKLEGEEGGGGEELAQRRSR